MSCQRISFVPRDQFCRPSSDDVIPKVEFTGRLRIYSVSGYQEGSVLRAEVTSPRLWDHYIGVPGLADEWIITYNKATGAYEIKEGFLD